MFIGIYNTFCCKYMKLIGKCKKIIGKYLNWLEFQIPAFRSFCKTGVKFLKESTASSFSLVTLSIYNNSALHEIIAANNFISAKSFTLVGQRAEVRVG